MPIRFHCTHCGKKLSIGTRKAGNFIQCPCCSGDTIVPTPPGYIRPPSLLRRLTVALAVVRVLVLVLAALATWPVVTILQNEKWDDDGRIAEAASWPREEGRPELLSVSTKPKGQPPASPMQTSDPTIYRLELPPPIPFPAFDGPDEPVVPSKTTEPAAIEDMPKAGQPAPAASADLPTAQTKDVTAVQKSSSPEPKQPVPIPSRRQVVEEKWAARWLKRRSTADEEELRRQLVNVPEAGVESVPTTTNVLLTAIRAKSVPGDSIVPILVANRPDLAALPLRMGHDCQLGKEPAGTLQALSRKLRIHLEAAIQGSSSASRPGSIRRRPTAASGTVTDPRPDPEVLRARLLNGSERGDWLCPEAVPALQQLLMAEGKAVRLVLVELLSQIKGKRATEAIAQRALYDLHEDVRDAALKTLLDRPTEEYRSTLLQGLRYPWKPVQDHAAEALMMLDLQDAVPDLIALLDENEPGKPLILDVNRKKVRVVRELVRINHLGNCLLCHATSHSRDDLVRGNVPLLGEALPAPATTPQYYDSNRNGIFVRADVTYLRQDFSLPQPVPNADPWPSHQRFDYLLRLRPVPEKDLITWEKQRKELKGITPRGETVLYALRELTGKNPGPTIEDWKTLYPIRDVSGRTPPGQQGAGSTVETSESKR